MTEPSQIDDNQISIVIPTYNRVATLKKVLGSYLEQPRIHEIIIVDDGSVDETETYIQSIQKKHKRLVYIRHPENRGLPASRNTGALRASGSFVVFGEDDLRFGSEYAGKLMDCLIRNSASIAAGRIIFPLPGETDEGALTRAGMSTIDRIDPRRIAFNATAYTEHETEVPFIHAICMVRKEVFSSVTYDPVFRGNAYREETDFYLRAGKEGHRIMFCPGALCVHLPREVEKLGGCMAKGLWTYKYWSIRNNYIFLRRHHRYLRENRIVQSGFWPLMLYFTLAEAKKIPGFYLRKYTPGLYTILSRRFGQ